MAPQPFGKKLSQKNAGEQVGLTISEVKTRRKHLITQICKKLRFPDEVAEKILSPKKNKKAEKHEFHPVPPATIRDLAAVIETRRLLSPSHWFRHPLIATHSLAAIPCRKTKRGIPTWVNRKKIDRRILSLRGLPWNVIAEAIHGEFAVKLDEADIQGRCLILVEAA